MIKIHEYIISSAFSPETSDTAPIIFVALGVIAVGLFIFIRRRR